MRRKASMYALIMTLISLSLPANSANKATGSTDRQTNPYGTVVILNGPSSSGKTSIIKAFQEKCKSPWLCPGVDLMYNKILPFKYSGTSKNPDFTYLVNAKDNKGDLVLQFFGPEGQKVMRAMHRAIAAYACEGNNLILDYNMIDRTWLKDLMDKLSGIKVFWVAITASLATLEYRNEVRPGGGTLPKGYERGQWLSVHEGINYDLVIDTDLVTSDSAANIIITFLRDKGLDVH